MRPKRGFEDHVESGRVKRVRICFVIRRKGEVMMIGDGPPGKRKQIEGGRRR